MQLFILSTIHLIALFSRSFLRSCPQHTDSPDFYIRDVSTGRQRAGHIQQSPLGQAIVAQTVYEDTLKIRKVILCFTHLLTHVLYYTDHFPTLWLRAVSDICCWKPKARQEALLAQDMTEQEKHRCWYQNKMNGGWIPFSCMHCSCWLTVTLPRFTGTLEATTTTSQGVCYGSNEVIQELF